MEVRVELKSRAVFLSGETIECSVTFTNGKSEAKESLAWSSVQIQCLRQVSAGGGASPPRKDGAAASEATSLGQPSSSSGTSELCSTSPKILFCDLILSPGETRAFEYRDAVPDGCPSSYQGCHVRYLHRLIVASQRVNCPISVLKVPIRVLSLDPVPQGRPLRAAVGDKPAISNPFASQPDEGDEDATRFNCSFFESTGRKKATYYDIRASEGKRVGKLCLFRTTYRLGDDILGLFDFSQVDIDCLQYSVSLTCEEKLSLNGVVQTHNKAVSKQSYQEFCLGYAETSFSVAVPLHATPTFKMEECCLSWMLRFEFVISKTTVPRQPYVDGAGDVSSMGHEWNGPSKLEVETMTWNLPVTLLPNHPQAMAAVIPLSTTASSVV